MRRGVVAVVAVVLIVVGGVLILVGTGSKSYDTADDLLADLTEIGFPCGPDGEVTHSEETSQADEASCDYQVEAEDSNQVAPEVETIWVTVYKTDGGQDMARGMSDSFGAFGASQVVWGDGWSVALDDRTNAEAIAAELNGELL